MIGIIDYGVGNLFSLKSSLEYVGLKSIVSNNKDELIKADRIILPGVGAFRDAFDKLNKANMIKFLNEIKDENMPLMGICLGMQLLFERSYEYGTHGGLGYLKGEVIDMKKDIDSDLKIPHMGWNKLSLVKSNPLLKYTSDGEFVYFVHSYMADNCEDSLVAYSEYGCKVPAMVSKNNIYGCQFHPEKSGETGLNILKAFNEV
ncbi:MAG TPA: imidazole glycerol phosphate synthase subunit HisH [Anaerovoracaceae bacterium]|nr:imidazole glycerol phosphate synthase subunit HisH [Anaerovoracaceae bacterium]